MARDAGAARGAGGGSVRRCVAVSGGASPRKCVTRSWPQFRVRFALGDSGRLKEPI
jgi:hypothetical protein